MSPIPKYTEEEFKKAFDMAKKGNSIRQSAFAYGIPVSTLRKALVKGILPNTDKHSMAQQLSVLTSEEEKRLYDWMLKCGERGHPRTSKQILSAAYELSLEAPRPNNFPNSKPSKMWLMRFFRRVQERHNMLCLNVMRPSSLVSDYSLQRNHERLDEYLKKNGLDEVLETPERIGSCDDVLLNLIAGHRDDKNYVVDVYNSIDVVFTGLANGKMLASHIIFKETHLKDIPSKVDLSNGASENGFLNAENFLMYLKNVIVRFLEENSVKRPFLLFIDDIGATLDIAVYEYCEEQQIFLVTAYPNDVWVLTPMDCGPIHTIKSLWNNFLIEKRVKSIAPRNFCSFFIDFMKDLKNDNTNDVKAALKNGFKDTGIFPWDINCIDMNAMTTFSRTRKENENKQHYGHLETRYVCTPKPDSEDEEEENDDEMSVKSRESSREASPEPIKVDEVQENSPRNAFSDNKICRLCLNLFENGAKAISVKSEMPRSVALDTKTYADAFLSCTGFTIKSSESQDLCKLCSLELIAAYRFIEKCRNTQETVNKWHEQTNVEQEDDNDVKDDSVSSVVSMKEENDENVTEMDDDDDLTSEMSGKYHFCTYCNVQYTTLHNLRQHLKKKHAKPINCDHCNIICKTSSAMDTHMRQVHPEVPIELPCNTCSHIFKGYFDRERTSHKCPQLFSCVTCNKTFANRSRLTMHESTHRDERGNVCEICGATFKTGPSLQQHLVGHRQDANYECQLCDMAFKRRLGLQMHMTKKHPQEKLPGRGEVLNKSCRKRLLEKNLKKVGNIRNVDKNLLETIGGIE